MDDFGSGYSSLGMLSALPIDVLKLDIQFVRSAFRDQQDTRLLEAMIQLAESFEVPTVAEGVETAEQAAVLKSMGCDYVQGYYFSRPIPPQDLEVFIRKRKTQAEPEQAVLQEKEEMRVDHLTDPLTGLFNAEAFDLLFHDGEHRPGAVLLAEVAGYADLKQEKGQAYADRVACRVADELREGFMTSGYICRIQEDEYAVLATHATGTGKDHFFMRIGETMRHLQTERDGLEPVRLNVGFAFPDPEIPEDGVFRDAGTVLRHLKDARQHGQSGI
jgi:predicted signal transduction protein with EAL and GGDEF domain